MLPGTLEEKRQLLSDIMDHLNFFPKVFERKNPWVIGMLAHKLTDPREQKPLGLPRGTRVISAIKKDKALWERVQPYVKLDEHAWSTPRCKCLHFKASHTRTKSGYIACTSGVGWGATLTTCKCTHYRERGL